MAAKRVILDTNIWLDWLVFNDSSLLHLKRSFSEGQMEVFIDAACEAELERVLAARADALLTKDHKLLELARRTKSFRILNPRRFSTQ